MMTLHTPPPTLADALDALADRMDQHPTSINFVSLAGILSQVVDGPGGSAWRKTSHPELVSRITATIAPKGFLSPIPTVDQVRAAARQARTS